MKTITDDTRPIEQIVFDDDEGGRFKVGSSGVTKIEAYSEYREMASVPWLAVYVGEEMHSRWPSRMCGIIYFDLKASK